MGRITQLFRYTWTSPFLRREGLPPYQFEIPARNLVDALEKINERLSSGDDPRFRGFEVLAIERVLRASDSSYVAARIIDQGEILWDD